MSGVAIAYIPVLHEGYRRFIAAHATDARLFLIGPALYRDHRPLAKDIRALSPELLVPAISSWRVASEVGVLDLESAERLAEESPSITLPAEDVSYQLVERYFARCEVRYDTIFLRWDTTRTSALNEPRAALSTGRDGAIAEIAAAAQELAVTSADWWRQVGAAIRFADGAIATAVNEHLPHPQSAYVVGDPRANYFKGVALELSTAVHAEARLIARAARAGTSTEGAVMYVTDFPCPPCAKLIAGAGVTRLYFRTGYAVLDGEDVLRDAGVELLRVA